MAVDTSQITSLANRIISGAARADSSQPDFLRANGAAASMSVLGATTNIILSINALAATVSTDIVKTSLTVAPSTNNTALVNDATMSNDLYAGEDDTEITIGTVGSEISALIGQYIALKTATGEIMYGFLKDATTLTNVLRGFFFDSAGAPIVRGNLSDTNVLTLMNVGYVFVEDNGTTVDISYSQPVYAFEAPSGPATGQYWFDITNQTWKRYSGTEFVIINRILVGMVVLDATNAIATRTSDLTNKFSDFNNVDLDISSTEIIKSKSFSSRLNVYGTEVTQDLNKLSWNITTDLEGGLTEAISTVYYLYVSIDGERIISDEKPYFREDLKGDYHPYHTWRLVGMAYNDASSNFTVKWSEFGENIVESATCGAYSTTSTSEVTITNLDINYLTRGRKRIKIGLNSDESGASSFIGIGHAGSGTSVATFVFYSGTTVLARQTKRNAVATDSTQYELATGLFHEKKLSLGFHNLIIKVSVNSASFTAYTQYSKLIAREV